MNFVDISADTPEQALAEGLLQLGIPREAVEMQIVSGSHDDLLPGAEPLPGVTIRLIVNENMLVATAKNHLKQLLEHMGTPAQIEILRRRGGVVLNIHAGEFDSLIIGRNGQNLEALQILVNRMVVHGGRDLLPIFVDCEGYLEKRLARLEHNAKRAAKQALRDGKEVALEVMSPFERKMVHNAMKEFKGISTISRGEGAERHIVVCPGEDAASVLDRRQLKPHKFERGARSQGAAAAADNTDVNTDTDDFDSPTT